MKAPAVADTGTVFVSLSNVKNAVRRLLTVSSTARTLILAEKDLLPEDEAVAKFEVFDRLLSSELER